PLDGLEPLPDERLLARRVVPEAAQRRVLRRTARADDFELRQPQLDAGRLLLQLLVVLLEPDEDRRGRWSGDLALHHPLLLQQLVGLLRELALPVIESVGDGLILPVGKHRDELLARLGGWPRPG